MSGGKGSANLKGENLQKKLFLSLAFVLIITALLILVRGVKPGPRIAFVIDDWGYNFKNIDLVNEINCPINISILPNLRYSRKIAEEFKNNSLHDIMLHLPLESKSNIAAELNTIRSSMDKDEILSILRDDLGSIPGVIGVSSHQGSKATEDKALMSIVLSELKKRDLFFLDSFTTPNSICSDLAGKLGVRYTTRDVFLDITDKTDLDHFESYIKKQINELGDVAIKSGVAVGVGHNIEITLKAIKYSIPLLEAKGIKIVPLKELVK
ncbi:divergent polysaccharide deacetylase family protein [Candidatus Omnitrophota bacterium]